MKKESRTPGQRMVGACVLEGNSGRGDIRLYLLESTGVLNEVMG